jgi:hypothetical protein
VLRIDLGENVCSIVGLDASGAVVLRRRVLRETLIDLVAKLPACIVGMEACCGAHHLGRLFTTQGHNVRLMSPKYVRRRFPSWERALASTPSDGRRGQAVRADCSGASQPKPYSAPRAH